MNNDIHPPVSQTTLGSGDIPYLPIEGVSAVEVSPRNGLLSVNPPNKLLNVAKVNMAFNGVDNPVDRSSILGNQNPFGKLDALARARQHRLLERNGNPMVDFIKKREEQFNHSLVDNSKNSLASHEKRI